MAARTTAALLALVIALAAIALSPGGLGGSRADAASVAINPARIEQAVKDGDKLTPIAVSNRGNSEILVRVSVEEGGHDLNGMLISRPLPTSLPRQASGHTPGQVPAIRGVEGADGIAGGIPAHAGGEPARASDPAHPNAPTLVMEPEQFMLGPGETRLVSGVISIPRGFRGGFYPVVVFECSDIWRGGGADDKGDKANSPNAKNDARGNFSPISRIAAITMLTITDTESRKAGGRPGEPGEPGELNWPDEPGRSGEITGVDITQDHAGAPVTIVSTFKNTGNIHVIPTGTVTVSAANGTNLATIPLEPAVVLPGYSRNLTARWCPDTMAAGEYSIYPRIMVAAKQITGPRIAFTVIRPYELARLAGEIVELEITHKISSDGEPKPTLSALFYNSGNLDFKPKTVVEVYSRSQPSAPPRLIRRKEIGPGARDLVVPAGGSYPIECPLAELLSASPLGSRVLGSPAATSGMPEMPGTPGMPGTESYTAAVTILDGDRTVAAAKVDFRLRGNEIALAPLSSPSSSSPSPLSLSLLPPSPLPWAP